MTTALATVVIVNYNGAHLLGRCLDALHRQDLPSSTALHTVVVDNASTDGSLALLAQRYPWVRVIASPRNLGFAGGNNLALRDVDTRYAVLLNNDAIPDPGWLGALLSAFEDSGAERLGAVTGKVLFQPRFVRLDWQSAPAVPAAQAASEQRGRRRGRPAGTRVHRVEVDGAQVTDKVLWEDLASAPQGSGDRRFRWARSAGSLLVPLPLGPDGGPSPSPDLPVTIRIVVSAPSGRAVTLSGPGCQAVASVTGEPTEMELKVPAGTEALDVINNAGGIVLRTGHGADRGFQRVDDGGYDQPAEVFAACGNGVALRVDAGREVGWFDERFFLYYEDTDLSWRLRSRGWAIRYQPRAVLRHVHSASSREWSPVWLFHVERNRLLMLTKNATGRLAAAAVLRFPLTTASMLARSALESARTGHRLPPGPHLVRARVVLSYLRLLGPMLWSRRRLGRTARLDRRDLERWLVTDR